MKEARRVVEPLTIEQVNELLGAMHRYRDLGIVYLMLLCGLRSHEVLALRESDIDIRDARLRVRGKGGKERSVPVPPLLLKVLARYKLLERPEDAQSPTLFVVLQGEHRGEAMGRAALRKVFRTRRARKSLRNANPHRLRHTFGTDMARSGVRLPVLQKMLGHAFLETTLQYVNIAMVDVAEEFERATARIAERYQLPEGQR